MIERALYSYALKTSLKRWPVRKGLILRWKDGWGEIAPLPGFSKETLEEARDEILSLIHSLSHAKPKLPSVRFALFSAAKGPLKPVQIPLCLLNNPREGFSHLKLKLGNLSVSEAVDLARKHLKHFRLRLDFNRKWTLEMALRFAEHFSPGDFEYLEDPVGTMEETSLFYEMTRFPIAIDEAVQLPSFPIKRVHKPTIWGPPKLPAVLSSAFESSLGLLQIASMHQNGDPPAGLDTFRFFEEDLLVPPLEAKDGFLSWAPNSSCPLNEAKLCRIA